MIDFTQLGNLLGAIPGSAAPALWAVRHSPGHEAGVNLDDHTAYLPGGNTPWDISVSQHEAGHVRWDFPFAKLSAINAALSLPSVLPWWKMVREWVIDLRLVSQGIEARIGLDKFDWSSQSDPASRPEEVNALSWAQLAYLQTGSQSADLRTHAGELWSLLKPATQAQLTTAFGEIVLSPWDDDLSASWAIRLAAIWDATRATPQNNPSGLSQAAVQHQAQQQQQNAAIQNAQNALNAPPAPPPSPGAQKAAKSVQGAMQTPPPPLTGAVNGFTVAQALQKAASEPDASVTAAASSLQAIASGPRKAPPKAESTSRGRSSGKSAGGHKRERWSQYVTICNHLGAARPGKRIKSPKGASEEGSILVDIPRVYQDRRPFREAPRPAGTIVVDTSGSMGWTAEDLEHLVRRAPGLVVGLYSNDTRGGDRARICIVARDGKRANVDEWRQSCRPHTGNEGSDLPALEWLADRRQKGPKFILSDGQFWGCGNRIPATGRAYEDACVAVMQKGRILRVPHVESLIDIANGKPAPISTGDSRHKTVKRRPDNR